MMEREKVNRKRQNDTQSEKKEESGRGEGREWSEESSLIRGKSLISIQAAFPL